MGQPTDYFIQRFPLVQLTANEYEETLLVCFWSYGMFQKITMGCSLLVLNKNSCNVLNHLVCSGRKTSKTVD